MISRPGFALTIVLFSLRPPTAFSEDIGECLIARGEQYVQCTTNRADTILLRGHSFSAVVFPTYDGSIVSATVTPPGGSAIALSGNGLSFATLSQPGVTTSLPGPALKGVYRFSIDTHIEGVQSLKLSLPGVATGIPPLHVVNSSDARSVDATQAFTVGWDKPLKPGRNDYVQLAIYETNGTKVFSVPRIDAPQTNAVIPAGTLQPDTTYHAYLYLIHTFQLKNSQPPVLAVLEFKETQFELKTLNPAGQFRFAPDPILANEQDGTVTATVERIEGSEGQVTVDYFSTDGSAHSNVNYDAVSGTLTFPAGVTNQSVTVPLLNDGIAASPLTLRLTLTNATAGSELMVRPHKTLTILDSQSPPGTNINAYLLARVQFYSQDSTNPPAQSNLCVAARFYTSVQPKFRGAVTNALLQKPNGVTRVMTNTEYDIFEYNEDFPSTQTANKTFPAGKYKFTFQTLTDGSFSTTLTAGTDRPFSVPHLANWEALQTADPSAPLLLQWDAFTGATSNDFVLVSIRDPLSEYVFQTPVEFENGALPGTTPGLTIPAGTLDFGEAYFANVIFVKVIYGKQVFPGIRNGIASVHTTSFYLHTVPQFLSQITSRGVRNDRIDANCHCAGSGDPAPEFFATPASER